VAAMAIVLRMFQHRRAMTKTLPYAWAAWRQARRQARRLWQLRLQVRFRAGCSHARQLAAQMSTSVVAVCVFAGSPHRQGALLSCACGVLWVPVHSRHRRDVFLFLSGADHAGGRPLCSCGHDKSPQSPRPVRGRESGGQAAARRDCSSAHEPFRSIDPVPMVVPHGTPESAVRPVGAGAAHAPDRVTD
jgi:hypothetical protein